MISMLFVASLGCREDKPILEEIKKLPAKKARHVHQQLYDIEMELAHQAQPQPDVERLLNHLAKTGSNLGILTRNSLQIAFTTLQASGLIDYFQAENILGRECCAPKPAPEGVLKLIDRWAADPSETVMVGDYWFDLKSGYDAGAHTIHFDADGTQSWPDVTHFRINAFREVTDLIIH